MAKAEAREVVIDAGHFGEFTFHVNPQDYSTLMGEIARNAHVACSNLLQRCVDEKDEQRWKVAAKENLGLPIEVGTLIANELGPSVGATVKKSKPSQTT